MDGTKQAQQPAPRRKHLFKASILEAMTAYLFLAPVIIGLLVWTLGPILGSLYLSFTEWDLLSPPKWVGLSQYVELFHDSVFRVALLNTLYYVAGVAPGVVVVSLLLAVVMNQKLKGTVILRSIYFAPSVTSMAAIAMLWSWIYEPSFGILNFLLEMLHLPAQPWLVDTRTALPSIMIMSIWRGVGYDMVIFLAGLQGIPQVYYEAAAIDGASTWQRFRHVTLPLLSPTTFFVLVLAVIGSLQVFQQAYVMTRGGPALSTTTLVYYLYRNGFEWFKMGKASSIAWVSFVLIAIASFIQFRTQRRWVHYE